MKRWVTILGFAVALAVGIIWIDLPFGHVVYESMMRLRGLDQPHPDIFILTLEEHSERKQTRQGEWKTPLSTFLNKLERYPPKVIGLDFNLTSQEERALRIHQRNFPVVYCENFASPHAHDTGEHAITLNYKENSTSPSHGLLLPGDFNSALLAKTAPEKTRLPFPDEPLLTNVAGPPGTFPRKSIPFLINHDSLLSSLEGKILLISAPPERVHTEIAPVPFFPSGGATGLSATEFHANVLDTILRDRGIRLLPPSLSHSITFVITVVSVIVLFGTVPLLGILVVILISVLLILASLAALDSFVYLDVSKPIVAIAFTYYFLIPYRLIVEYKGRWQYQQENKLLSEVETLKDNFMSLVSHNLKTPIARITGLVENLLRKRDLDLESTRKELKTVLHSAEDLSRFVSRILYVSRVEHPEYQLRIASKDVNQLLEKVIEGHQALAHEKGISITTQLEPLFPVPMDADLIQESIVNLVENAIKYTPPQGNVHVSTSESGDWVQVSIADSGPGISPEEREKIFSKFYRGSDVKNKGAKGTGLGLYLVKYFVELHGGSVEVRNRPGGGSLFTLSLLRK